MPKKPEDKDPMHIQAQHIEEEIQDASGDDTPYAVRIDLIARELEIALRDVEDLRLHERRKLAAKGRCKMLEAALRNARYYLREFEKSL
jgi:hypothetical protein